MRWQLGELAVEAEPEAGSLVLSGELAGADGEALEHSLSALSGWPARIRIDMSTLELADGRAAVTAVNLIRQLLVRAQEVIVVGAPQSVGHTLYRVGLLQVGSRIRLQDMREDEAYG